MTYRGHIKNGVVVLDDSPSLAEGMVVEVVPILQETLPKRGSAEAIMRHAGIWAGVAQDVDRQLAELKEMKRLELENSVSAPQSIDDVSEK